MAKDNNIQDFLTDVADAIREKKGTTDKINPQDFSSEIASIQSGGRDWSEIGYDAEPSFIEEGLAYAKEIMDNWDNATTNVQYKFQKDENLIFLPNLNYDNATSIDAMCYQSRNLIYVDSIVAPKCTTAYSLFEDCTSLVGIREIYLPNCTSFLNLFKNTNLCKVVLYSTGNVSIFDGFVQNCKSLDTLIIDITSAISCNLLAAGASSLNKVTLVGDAVNVNNFQNSFRETSITEMHELNSVSATNMHAMFYTCRYLQKIHGIDFTSVTNAAEFVGECRNLRYLLIKNLGKSSLTSYTFNTTTNWGVANDEIADARQSLIDSLITYSYDRASNGMSTAIIKLSANTKALLTEEEIAQITNKGFTIS